MRTLARLEIWLLLVGLMKKNVWRFRCENSRDFLYTKCIIILRTPTHNVLTVYATYRKERGWYKDAPQYLLSCLWWGVFEIVILANSWLILAISGGTNVLLNASQTLVYDDSPRWCHALIDPLRKVYEFDISLPKNARLLIKVTSTFAWTAKC